MELGVRVIGVFLRLLHVLLAPLFWLRARYRPLPPPPANPVLLQSAVEQAAAIRNGEIKSEYLVTTYIDRIKEVDKFLNAVVENRFRDALEEARAADRKVVDARNALGVEYLAKNFPLLGVPFTVKESCSLAGLSNAVGCLEHRGSRASTDGEAVRLIREAGAIPLLVSNTPELCLGWETTNLLLGTTNNPYDLNRTPGGSSGGEGALLACGATSFSVASDVAGSIRVPAAFCGVFGHKPTPGVVSIVGHKPYLCDELFPRFLTVGPMARKAVDLPVLLNIMAGNRSSCLRLNEEIDMNSLRVYYMTEAGESVALMGVDEAVQGCVRSAAEYLAHQCGATLMKEKFEDLESSVETSVSVFFSMKDIPNMLQDPADPKIEKNMVLEMYRSVCGIGTRSLQALLFTLVAKTQLFIPKSRRSYYMNKAAELRDQLTKTLGDDGVLLYPVSNGLAHYHNEVFLKASGVMYTMIFNILGLPATTVPMGLREGLPVGIQVIAGPNQDRLCLAVAKQLETGFGGWRPSL